MKEMQRMLVLLLAGILVISQAKHHPWNLPAHTHSTTRASISNYKSNGNNNSNVIEQYQSSRKKSQLQLHVALSIQGGDIDSDDDESDSDSDSDGESESEYDNDNDASSDTDTDTDTDTTTTDTDSDASDEYDSEESVEETKTPAASSYKNKNKSSSLSTSLKKKSNRKTVHVEEVLYDEPLALSAIQDMGITLGTMLVCNKLDLSNAKIIKYARYVWCVMWHVVLSDGLCIRNVWYRLVLYGLNEIEANGKSVWMTYAWDEECLHLGLNDVWNWALVQFQSNAFRAMELELISNEFE